MRLVLIAIVLIACDAGPAQDITTIGESDGGVDLLGPASSSPEDAREVDDAATDAADASPPLTNPDLADPSLNDCFANWRMLGSACGPPILTRVYDADDCNGMHGIIVEGSRFELDHVEQQTFFGPELLVGSNVFYSQWTVLAPDRACFAQPGNIIPGLTGYLRNPDGQISQEVPLGK